MNDSNNKSEKITEIIKLEDSNLSFDEKWNKVLGEVVKQQVDDVNQMLEEYNMRKEYEKKYGKEPDSRTPDGSINKKYIDYILRRDFGIMPDSNSPDPFENFSWGGMTGIEAYIGKMNFD
jgi:hypothetical protein